MHVIRVRNVHEALPEGIRELLSRGIPTPSRAGEVLVLPEPVTTVYARPTERVIFWPERNANPFFHFFESLWLLAGRRDLAFLTQFIKTMEKFSDDGKTLHGAYGWRWRNYFKMDQITVAIEMLRKDPRTRRVVLTMFDPKRDLGVDSNDVPCLGGNTVLASPEGPVHLKELAKRFTDGLDKWPVYSFDPKSKSMQMVWCTKVWKSGVKRAIRLTFNDDTYLDLTEDHRLFAKKRYIKGSCEEVTAGSLKPGDRVWASQIFAASHDDRPYFKRYLDQNTNFGNQQKVHNAYFALKTGIIPQEPLFVVHHKNENKQDNSWGNLEGLTKSEHDALHRRGDNNPMRRMSQKQHRARASKATKKMLKTKASWTEAELNARYGNHEIVSVRRLPKPIEVYDFEVPDHHNAMLENGVFVHNCNQQVFLWNLAGRLQMTVTCRSNDIIWGAYGANAVHFSMLQEYIAGMLGLEVGTMYQVSNNYHAYLDTLEPVRCLADQTRTVPASPYESVLTVEPYPIMTVPKAWDLDLKLFLAHPDSNGMENPFFARVAKPLWYAHQAYKVGDIFQALEIVDQCQATDWRMAAIQWLNRKVKR